MEDYRKVILKQRSDLARLAAEKLASEPKADISTEIDFLEAHDKLLAALPTSRRRDFVFAAVIGLLCLLAVSLAWSLHLPTTRLTAVVDTDFAALQLDESWIWPADLLLDEGTVRLVDFTTIELPLAPGQAKIPADNPSVVIENGKLTLSRMSLLDGGKLKIERDANEGSRLFISGGQFSGEFAVWGKPKISVGSSVDSSVVADEYYPDFTDADIVRFSLDRRSELPARLELPPEILTKLPNLHVDKLSFAQEIEGRPGEIEFTPSVLGGKVTISDLATDISLAEGDRLTLDGVSGLVQEVQISDKITVKFVGSVHRIYVGDVDKTPRLLEYLYYNQRLLFFWTVVTFLGGTLWSVRAFFLN